jgi:hypothetical protein
MLTKEKQIPALKVIQVFGTNAEVSRILSISRSTVTRWSYPKNLKGTGGLVPQKYWAPLLQAARKRKIKLSLRDLSGL